MQKRTDSVLTKGDKVTKLHKLTQKQINEAQRTACEKEYRLSDGGGLSLHVRPAGALYWAVEVTIKANVGRGKRVAIGLGHYPDIDLKTARTLASDARTTASEGVDPREARKAKIADKQKERLTFRDVFLATFEAKKPDLKDAGKAGNWDSPVRLYALPKLGDTPIEDITQHDLVETLRPIWQTKVSIAGKCMDRVGLTFKHAAAMDLDVSLETVPKARILLGKQKHKPKSIPAMPWPDVPTFYDTLNEDLVSHLALKLVILTGSRSGSVRMAHVDQFDGDVWSIPADNMKGGEAFEIPLSTEAQRVVAHAIENSRDGFLFPSPVKGVISDMAMAELMKGRGLVARPHGFRSTLRDWMTEETNTQWDTREKVLAHKVGNAVSRAYDRTTDLKRRAEIMELWGNFVTGKVEDNVIPLRAKA